MSATHPVDRQPTAEPAGNPGELVHGQRPVRVVTATSLFDGHDAAINIMRRLLQQQGAEVVHLGHNRSVHEVVRAALQEDADAIAVSSYQGGHDEYFRYMLQLLAEQGAGHVRVFGGGGGVIVPEEIAALQDAGVERIYSPEDGRTLGLEGMIADMIARTRAAARHHESIHDAVAPEGPGDHAVIARFLSWLEAQADDPERLQAGRAQWPTPAQRPPVLGITGPGGAGKSSLTDELLSRLLAAFPDLHVAVLAVDPTRRRTGGALLGDRIRFNVLGSSNGERLFMRSIATRRSHLATSAALRDAVDYLASVGFGLVVVETAGIGQSDSEIVDLVDHAVYVMTAEYGAATQLEKIDMLDYADTVVLNKFEKRGAEDALRDVRKQWQRNRNRFDLPPDQVPVYPTIASQFNDAGVNRLFLGLCASLAQRFGKQWYPRLDSARALPTGDPEPHVLIPAERSRYLAEIAANARAVARHIDQQAAAAASAWQLHVALGVAGDAALPEWLAAYPATALADDAADATALALRQAYNAAIERLDAESIALLRAWPQLREGYRAAEYAYQVRGREITGQNYIETLSHLRIPKVALPRFADPGELLRFLLSENLPGRYPYTAGVYPYRRSGEDPTRMFAGEGTPERTNRRFHLLAQGQPATRLSTAFDSVTLYGEDPDPRPDIYGKIGNAGVSICTLDDAKKLYSGFDLCDPATSVSLTINGPAPAILAMFLNTAIDQQAEKHLREQGDWQAVQQRIAQRYGDQPRPQYRGDLPGGNTGLGLGLLGVTADQVLDPETYERIKADTLHQVRGTVQADILKEDQAQNTCIFSTEFALRMMGDVQAAFTDLGVRNFYSVSVSGYHIAEAGANPISQLAFTLSNGFTIIEYYLARGMAIDDFAANMSFFFSNGMDPEYAVMGRVARRIWARALRDRYGASPRSQMLKYHIQTSGRSLHAQEIQFNDIRTTLQALYALYDSCNSLHTNAYDEAITTPTDESVRRAMAIQLIINRELGLNKNENPLQGSFIIEELTDLVEEAVYQEFERIAERGGVLGAMETMYQRGKIQEESLEYEHKKHDGSLPIVGVNTFLADDAGQEGQAPIELIRSTEAEKQQQIESLEIFQRHHAGQAPAALAALQRVATSGGNTFAELMETVKHCSLGQITHALYEVGGQYRRNM